MRPADGRAIPTFIRQALAGEPLTVAGDGSQTRSVCHVDDLVEGVLRLAFSDHPGPVNIGNPNELSVLQLAQHVLDITGSDSPISFIPRPQDDPHVRQPDITLAREVLGWEPQVSLHDGLARTVRWFEETYGTGRRDLGGRAGRPTDGHRRVGADSVEWMHVRTDAGRLAGHTGSAGGGDDPGEPQQPPVPDGTPRGSRGRRRWLR
jgi:hypothetical protein